LKVVRSLCPSLLARVLCSITSYLPLTILHVIWPNLLSLILCWALFVEHSQCSLPLLPTSFTVRFSHVLMICRKLIKRHSTLDIIVVDVDDVSVIVSKAEHRHTEQATVKISHDDSSRLECRYAHHTLCAIVQLSFNVD
jgi:hypothetical protein